MISDATKKIVEAAILADAGVTTEDKSRIRSADRASRRRYPPNVILLRTARTYSRRPRQSAKSPFSRLRSRTACI